VCIPSDDLLHIQSICRDLRSVLPDLTFYLRERERVQSYEKNDIGSLPPRVEEACWARSDRRHDEVGQDVNKTENH